MADGRFAKAFDQTLERFCQKYEFKREDARKMFKVFQKADKDSSGEISLYELFDILKINHSDFAQALFMVIDTGGENRIEFDEFLVGVLNYATCSHADIVRFAFDLVDQDGSGEISQRELERLIKMVHGRKGAVAKAATLLAKVDVDKSGFVSFSEFQALEKKNASLLGEAFSLQRTIQKECLGPRFWAKATERRVKNTRSSDTRDLIAQYYEKKNNGEKLCRASNRKLNQGKVREGWVNLEKGQVADLYAEATTESEVVGHREAFATIDIEETVDTVANVDGVEVTRTFYKLEPDADGKTGWIKAECVKIDKTFIRIESKAAALADGKKTTEAVEVKDTRAEKRQELTERRAKVMEEWFEATDQLDGSGEPRTYWVNIFTGRCTLCNPLDELHSEDALDDMGMTHEKFMKRFTRPLRYAPATSS